MEMENRGDVKEDPQDNATIEDWKRDTEETRAIWEMVEQDKIDRELLQKAEPQVSHFIAKLEQGIETRKKTISMLQRLTDKQDKTSKDLQVTQISSAPPGIWFRKTTYPLGAASSLTGDSVVALEIGGAEIEDTDMEEAQEVLDKDKQTLESIHKCYSNLVHIAETISASNPKHGAKEQVLRSLLMSSKLKGDAKNTKGLGDLEFTLAAGLLIGMGAILTTASKEFDALMSRLASRIGSVAGTEAAGEGVARGAEYGINIYKLVEVPQAIQTTCTDFKQQLGEMENILEEIEKYSKELWELTKKEFRELLENIARKKRATREEVKLVLNYLEIFQPSEEWKQAFRESGISVMLHVSCMAHIFIALGSKVEKKKKKDEEEGGTTEFMDITFIADGKITSPMLPCTLYYMSSPMNTESPGVKSITLYEPWGCAIDAKAAYGIATDLININNVHYFPDRLVLPQLPFGFNTLPYDNTPIPMAVFTPVKTDEGAYRELQALATTINANTGRLVIPYFQSPSDTSLPEIPLWALANDLDVIGRLLDIRINLHVAACLTTRDQSLVRQVYPDVPRPVVDCGQYCTVPVTQPPARMSCTLLPIDIPTQYSGLMATLDDLL